MPFINLPEGEISSDSSLLVTQVISLEMDFIAVADIAEIGQLTRSGTGPFSQWLFDLKLKNGETRRFTPIGNFGKTREEILSNLNKISSVIGEPV
ncbi:hypothetical protein TOTORO_00630 [Serratia phage vB_SmaS-Totoro]|nr:hypothetical protein TOTORO_00630 [Serratia phage vB_SmaS-Totoro]